MAKGVATVAPDFFYKKLQIKNQGQYGKFWIQLVKLKKFGTLQGWIAEIETLVFEFEKRCQLQGVNCNFS